MRASHGATPSILARTRVVLCHPFFPENLGAAARAMKNAGLSRLVVADPGPFGPDHPNALKLAVHSEEILATARIAGSFEEAIADATLVLGTTPHHFEGMRPLAPRPAAELAHAHAEAGGEVAIVFGNEKNGLTVEEIRRCHQVIRIPGADPETSLNLAQAIMIVAYEVYLASLDVQPAFGDPLTRLATEPEVAELATALEEALAVGGFFKPHNRSIKEATLRRVLSRTMLDATEVATLRGVAHRLVRGVDQETP